MVFFYEGEIFLLFTLKFVLITAGFCSMTLVFSSIVVICSISANVPPLSLKLCLASSHDMFPHVSKLCSFCSSFVRGLSNYFEIMVPFFGDTPSPPHQ